MPRKKRKERPVSSTQAQAQAPLVPKAEAAVARAAPEELRKSDAHALQEASRRVSSAVDALKAALDVVGSTSAILNIARARAELRRPLAELDHLAFVLADAGAVLEEGLELATHPERPVYLGAHISPHQLEMFHKLALLGRDRTLPVSEVYQRFQGPRTRPAPPPPANPVATMTPAIDVRYEASLRNELAGNDVGAEAFWAAVRQSPCTFCDASPGTPCITSGGWPSDAFHRPRRDAAAKSLVGARAED